MNNLWKQYNYDLVWTADGSPSLSWNKQELMHHRGGALSETQKIYAEVIADVLDRGGRSFLSLGLGLGYAELFILKECQRRQVRDVQILTYEADDFLKNQLLRFLHGERNEIHQRIIEMMDLKAQDLAVLLDLYQSGNWQILGALNRSSFVDFKAEAILYDAFSAKTSPELWQEIFLTDFIKNFASQDCFFSTYACTGSLKRSLKAENFIVTVREGFHGKRNSTLAVRGFGSLS